MDLKKLVDSLRPKTGQRTAGAEGDALPLDERLEHARRTTTARLAGKAGSVPMLGKILSDMGTVNERQLEAALSRQRDLVTRYCALEKQAEDSLWGLIASVTGTLDLETVLTLCMENAAKLTGAIASTLFLYDPITGELVFSVPTGPAASQLKDVRLPHGQGIAGWVAVHKQALIVPDVQQDSRFYSAIDATTGFITRSVLAVPILQGHELLGVLETINKEAGVSFTEEDALLLTVFAEQAASAINNARVHAALKDQLDNIRLTNDRIVEAEKFRALHTLSAGLSHDFKNLLNAVIGFAELVSLDIRDTVVKKDVEQITKAGQRALALLEKIQGIGGHHMRESLPIEANNLVSHACEQLKQSLSVPIQIDLALASAEVRISGDPVLLQSALDKVLANAVEAIGDASGLVSVSTRVVTISAATDDYQQTPPGRYYEVTVADDGDGIAEEFQRMVFEPYFTLKKGGMGKGLGLSTTRGIIQSHGGTIALKSAPGEGTTVRMLLPVNAI